MILQSIGLFSHGLQATAVLYDSSICTCRSSMGCDVLYIYLPVIAFRVSCLLAGGVATGLWLMAGLSPTFDVWDLTSYSFCIFNVYHLLNRHAGGIFTPNPSSCHLSAHQTRRQQTDHAISFLYTMISPEQKYVFNSKMKFKRTVWFNRRQIICLNQFFVLSSQCFRSVTYLKYSIVVYCS